MSDINTVTISGRVGADPIMKYFETGSVHCEISVGVNKYSSKKKVEEVTWHSCRAWGRFAEYIGDHAKAGSTVLISGSLEKDVFEDKEMKKRAVSYILIDTIKIIPKKEE